MSNKVYKKRKIKRKEKMNLTDKLEVAGIIVVVSGIAAWAGWSAAKTFMPESLTPKYEMYMDGITDYVNKLNEDVTEDGTGDEEDAAETETVKEATEESMTEAESKETETETEEAEPASDTETESEEETK